MPTSRGVLPGLALRRGQQALAAGDVEQARDQLREVRDARPKWALARLWLATAESELGELDRARDELEQARSLSPAAQPVSALWLGRILIDHERFADARAALEQVSVEESSNIHVPGYLTLARWADDGDDVLDEVGWEVPPGGGELWGRWLVEIETGFPGGPGVDCQVEPEPPRSPWQRLARWRAGRQVERAARLIAADDHIRAVGALDRAELLWPAEERAQELRVDAHCGAAAARQEQVERDPHDVELRLKAAEDLLEIGSVGAASRILEPVEELIERLDPDRLSWRAVHHLLRGRARLGGDEPELAVEDFSQAGELWPTEVEPLYYLGIAWLRAGERARGRRACVTACGMDSELAGMRLREYRGSR